MLQHFVGLLEVGVAVEEDLKGINHGNLMEEVIVDLVDLEMVVVTQEVLEAEVVHHVVGALIGVEEGEIVEDVDFPVHQIEAVVLDGMLVALDAVAEGLDRAMLEMMVEEAEIKALLHGRHKADLNREEALVAKGTLGFQVRDHHKVVDLAEDHPVTAISEGMQEVLDAALMVMEAEVEVVVEDLVKVVLVMEAVAEVVVEDLEGEAEEEKHEEIWKFALTTGFAPVGTTILLFVVNAIRVTLQSLVVILTVLAKGVVLCVAVHLMDIVTIVINHIE